MNKYIQIFTTTNDKKEAQKITQVLVEKRLAACTQILGPINSLYRWKGKTKTAKEYLCLIKSTGKKANAIVKEIKTLHSYEIPEIIILPIIGGSRDYLRWMEKEI